MKASLTLKTLATVLVATAPFALAQNTTTEPAAPNHTVPTAHHDGTPPPTSSPAAVEAPLTPVPQTGVTTSTTAMPRASEEADRQARQARAERLRQEAHGSGFRTASTAATEDSNLTTPTSRAYPTTSEVADQPELGETESRRLQQARQANAVNPNAPGVAMEDRPEAVLDRMTPSLTLAAPQTLVLVRNANGTTQSAVATQVETRLNQSQRSLARLEARAQTLDDDTREQFDEAVADAREAHRELQGTLQEFRAAAADEIEDLRGELAESYEAYADALTAAEQHAPAVAPTAAE